MARKTKQEMQEFANNVGDAIFEQFNYEQQQDIGFLIQKRISDLNVRRLVQQELNDMNKFLEKRFGKKIEK